MDLPILDDQRRQCSRHAGLPGLRVATHLPFVDRQVGDNMSGDGELCVAYLIEERARIVTRASSLE